MAQHTHEGPKASLPAPPPKTTRSVTTRPNSEQGQRAGIPQTPARAHVLLGPVGAGKSTYGLKLAQEQRALRLTLDEWMTELFSPDRPNEDIVPWYVERARRCLERIWSVARGALSCGSDVVLEVGLLLREERKAFFERLDEARVPYTVYVLDAARDVRRERVRQRNQSRGQTFAMVVPPEIFELASDRWQPLEDGECLGRDVRWIDTEGIDP